MAGAFSGPIPFCTIHGDILLIWELAMYDKRRRHSRCALYFTNTSLLGLYII